MSVRCFILSSRHDYEVASLCQAHMQQHGWTVQIMIDSREWEVMPQGAVSAHYSTLGRGMYGNDCASGILDGMIQHSQDGERLVKTDCDVWLSGEAAKWLTHPGKARAMNVYHRRWQQWGGLWSAGREQVISAREHADSLTRCRCAESHLNLLCLHATSQGCEAPASAVIGQWSEGERGYAAMLPIHRRGERSQKAEDLFV